MREECPNKCRTHRKLSLRKTICPLQQSGKVAVVDRMEDQKVNICKL